MKAYLKDSFKKSFIISEENIIKLNDIIKKRIMEKNIDTPIKYTVYRNDSLVYETNDHSQVTQEENSTRNKIEKLIIELESDDMGLKINIDKLDGVSISIIAEDKDFAYLLYTDIRSYISTEVCKLFSFKFKDVLSFKDLFPIIMVPLLIGMLYVISTHQPSAEELKQLLDSNDINAKLNYLIQINKNKEDLSVITKYSIPASVLFLILMFIGPMLDKLFPSNIFYWGKQAEHYNNVKSLKDKILWVIIIGLIIGVLASLIVFYATKN